MSYKETLNMPKTAFPMRGSLVNNSEKFKDFWASQNLYFKLSNRSGAEFFVLHDGPPYANGNIHLGHALNKSLKDFVVRYKALRGYSIQYVPGWDAHGLPIENKVEKTGGYVQRSSVDKRKACREYALQQIQNQKSQFQKLHLLTDFNKTYQTLDSSFVNFELDSFFCLLERGFLYWDLKPVAWSWSSETALAESEIVYKEITARSIYFHFPLSEDCVRGDVSLNKGTRFLIWTTTPYTLEANLAVAVNPEFLYDIVKDSKGNEWICLQDVWKGLGLEGEVKGTIKGKDLEGVKYLNPLTGEINRCILADFVIRETGTGIVHIAPGFGLEDYYACLDAGISVYVGIDTKGVFKDESKFDPIKRLFYVDAIGVVIDWLDKEGYLFKEETISHKVGHDWRTDKPLFYMASPQWFLNVSKLKQDLKGSIAEKVKSSPEWLSKKLEDLVLDRKEWCISRQRVWGTPIPILFYDGKPILELKQVKRNVELLSKEGLDIWFSKDPSYFVHPDLLSEFKDPSLLSKSKDILDVWFDSGCSWGILDNNKVADLYLEGFDQLRGWFNSSSVVSMAVNNRLPFKALLSHGFVLDKDGNKMSKSKGNVVDPLELLDKNGADVLRLWIGLNNFLEDIKMSDESLNNATTLYRKIRNTLFRYSLSVLPEQFSVDERVLNNLKLPENIYIYQSFRNTWKKMQEHLDDFLFFKAINVNLSFLNTYSSWYLEICKDTLYCSKKDTLEYREAVNIIGEIFEKNLFFYSIFLPQTSEEAWSHYKPEEKTSIFLQLWPELKGRDYLIDEGKWDKFWDLKDEIYAKIEELKNQKIISGPTEAQVTIPMHMYSEEFDLVKLLNVGEIASGDSISVVKCGLGKCERCNRHRKELNLNSLCPRCSAVVP